MHPDDRARKWPAGYQARQPGRVWPYRRCEVARTWLSIRADLIEGHGEQYWPRPGGIFAAARSHTFKQLADATGDAFARWDRSHLQEFTLADGSRLCDPDPDWEIEGEVTEVYRRVKLSPLHPGDQYAYVFDLGDDWAHLCTVGARRIDPAGVLGILPDTPLPYWGWGGIPDQYRRRWDDDDGESPPPRNLGLADLPPLRLRGGPGSRRPRRRVTAPYPGTCRSGNHPPGLPRAHAAAGARAEAPDPHH